MDRAHVRRWVEAYEGAWRAAGTDVLSALFAPDGRCVGFEEWPFAPGRSDGHENDRPPA